MCKVQFELDDDWKDDLIDLQGKVMLFGDDGTEIIDSCTNIDTFLAALSSIVLALKKSAEAKPRIDLALEPDPLYGTFLPNGEVELTYGRQTVRFSTLDEFDGQLRHSVTTFTAALPRGVIGDAMALRTLYLYLRTTRR